MSLYKVVIVIAKIIRMDQYSMMTLDNFMYQ